MERTPGKAPPPVKLEDQPSGIGDPMAESDGITIAPDADAVPAEPAAVTAAAPTAVDEGVASLQTQLAAERARAAAAEADRDRLAKQVQSSETAVADSRITVIDSAIRANNSEKDQVLASIRAAKEAGDYDAEIKAIDRLQVLNYNNRRMEEGKAELGRRAEEAKHRPAAPANPVDAMVQGMTSRSGAWVRSHPEFATDPARYSAMMEAHYGAVARGLTPDTDQYFAEVETKLGLRAAPVRVPDPEPAPVTPPPRREVAPSPAPVSRAANGAGAPGLPDGISMLDNGQYRLSPAAREAASMSGLTDAEYLKNALALQKEGRLGRTTH